MTKLIVLAEGRAQLVALPFVVTYGDGVVWLLCEHLGFRHTRCRYVAYFCCCVPGNHLLLSQFFVGRFPNISERRKREAAIRKRAK